MQGLNFAGTSGMRAVALTDVMEGIALLLGITVLLGGALSLVGGDLAGVAHYLAAHEPEKIVLPTGEDSVSRLSLIPLVAFGASAYPHAIQRICTARSERHPQAVAGDHGVDAAGHHEPHLRRRHHWPPALP